MANLYLPGPIRLVFGHKKLREAMCAGLQMPAGTTIFDLTPGALDPFLGRKGLLHVSSIIGRPALATMPVTLTPVREGLSFERALLRQGVTPIKLFPRMVADWEAWRGERLQAVQSVKGVLEHERARFAGTGFVATDPELQVPPQLVADDVLVTEVLDLLKGGELDLAPWRPWLTSVVDMAHAAADDAEREARLRWHLAVVCQHLRHDRVLAAMERRFGLEGEAWTLQACGDFAGITRERIRQLEDLVHERVRQDLYLSDQVRCETPLPWSVAA